MSTNGSPQLIAGVLDQLERVHRERRTPGAEYTSDRRMLEFVEYHLSSIISAARRGIATGRCSSLAPFIVQEQIGLPGDRIVYSAIDPSTGITTGAYDRREQAEHDAKALNAAYELGRNHESHDAGRIVQAARKVHECRQDDACNDAPHSCHVDLNAAIELADAIEQYDTYHENRSPMILDTEPRRLTDDELGGRAALEAAGLEPVDGWDDERGDA